MKVLNPRNLPQALVNAVSFERKFVDPKRIGVTDLISSPYVHYLKMLHENEIETDVEDMTWLILGRGIHSLLEKNSPDLSISEKKIVAKIDEFTIVGILDVTENKTIYDYKVVSTYAFILGDKPEWERQLNVYRYLLHLEGTEIDSIKIIAILRDWMPRKAAAESDYPQKPLISVDVKLWSLEETEKYIHSRLEAFRNPVTPCTPEERWSKPTTYAVKKNGLKTAKRVLGDRVSAENYIKDNNLGSEFLIEERPGEDTKCNPEFGYCPYAKWCEFTRYKNERS
jgi:hypothetical protein